MQRDHRRDTPGLKKFSKDDSPLLLLLSMGTETVVALELLLAPVPFTQNKKQMRNSE